MTSLLPLETGAIIGGHYQIEGLINTGGFGSVYRGLALSEGNRPTAIKETYDVTPSARRQALMEAAILFTIKSAHLPQVYDAFEEDGRFYLVMQLIEGQNCLQMVKAHGSAFSEQEVLDWLLPIADVLQELHGRNPPVLHRDIKPANIIITPQSRAVLVDFGLTRLYDPSVETQTLARAVSEGFSPLEQYVGQTSPRSDIYTLAATMYFMLTAQAPPASVARSMQDTLVPPCRLNPRLSPEIESILLKALAVDTENRFASMQAFAQALRAPHLQAPMAPVAQPQRYPNTQARAEMAPLSLPPLTLAPSWQPGEQMPGLAPSTQPRLILQQPPSYRAPTADSASRHMPALPVQPAPRRNHPSSLPAGKPHMAYPPVRYRSRPLPNPSNQGCLWGLLQGVLSALIILFLHQQGDFYLALGEGFLFYALAGFCTTRHGGPIMRALPAGIWAGIISTIVFWVVLPVILIFQALQGIDEARHLGVRLTFNQAIDKIKPAFLTGHAPGLPQQNWNNLLLYLAIGLLCTSGFALAGGILGYKTHRAEKR